MGWQSVTDKVRRIISISSSDKTTSMFVRHRPPPHLLLHGCQLAAAVLRFSGWRFLSGWFVALRYRHGCGRSMSTRSWSARVAQIILGGFLLLFSSPHSVGREETDSHPIPFWGMNGGVIGMLVGFWLHQPPGHRRRRLRGHGCLLLDHLYPVEPGTPDVEVLC